MAAAKRMLWGWCFCVVLQGGFSAESQDLPSLLWMAPVLNPGGFSSEALCYADALQQAYRASGDVGRFGVRQFAEHMRADFIQGLPNRLGTQISEMMQNGKRQPWDVVVCHSTPDVWHEDGAFGWGRMEPCPPAGTKLSIGRSMYETDRVPEDWVPRLNRMDQVWVPSQFGLEQFVSSGVKREKIAVVPEAVDTDHFNPSVEPLDLGPGLQGQYLCLSVFKWEKRKGWDILLRAYFEEFTGADNVLLIIKTQPFHSGGGFHSQVLQEIAQAQEAGADAKNPARYQLLSQNLALKDLPRLYRAADAFVLPSRGEGWGQPYVEAMSMALPVIGTNWSGCTEFLHSDVALPLPLDGLEPAENGIGQWAQPSRAQLRRLMRYLQQHPQEGKAIGKAARQRMVERFRPEKVVSQHILPLLQRWHRGLEEDLTPNLRHPPQDRSAFLGRPTGPTGKRFHHQQSQGVRDALKWD